VKRSFSKKKKNSLLREVELSEHLLGQVAGKGAVLLQIRHIHQPITIHALGFVDLREFVEIRGNSWELAGSGKEKAWE
jgi:hypothetical protein